MIGTSIGAYRITAMLGAGGMGEVCGLKGLRIFIHPDVDHPDWEMKEDWPGDLCEVTDDTPQPKMANPFTCELNYIEHEPDFEPRANGPQTTDDAYNELWNYRRESFHFLLRYRRPPSSGVHRELTFV